MIELLILAGLVALAILVTVGALFTLRHRRQGTVRAVLMPRQGGDGSTET